MKVPRGDIPQRKFPQGKHDADRDLVGTPFKLAQGGGVASVSVLGADSEAALADRLCLTAGELGRLR